MINVSVCILKYMNMQIIISKICTIFTTINKIKAKWQKHCIQVQSLVFHKTTMNLLEFQYPNPRGYKYNNLTNNTKTQQKKENTNFSRCSEGQFAAVARVSYIDRAC
jgi:hypothetical protein